QPGSIADIHHSFGLRYPARQHPTHPYRLIDGHKAHARIIGLLLRHAVEANGAPAEMGHARIPYRLAMPLPAPVLVADIEPDKAETAVIGDGCDGRYHLPPDKGTDKPFRVRRLEGDRVIEPRIPPLICRPVEQCGNFSKS